MRSQALKRSVAALIFAGAIHPEHAAAVEAAVPSFFGITIGVPTGITPPPGIYFSDTTIAYGGQKVDGQGRDVSTRLNLLQTLPTFLIATNYTILGGRYSFAIGQAYETTNLKAGTSLSTPSSGTTNTYIVPIDLGYRLSENLSARIQLGAYLQDGYYSATHRHTANKFGTLVPGLGLTYLRDGWQLSAFTRFNFNSENPSTSYQSGSVVLTDFSMTKSFDRLTVGVGGYVTNQFTNDRKKGVVVPATAGNSFGNKVFMVAAGPYISYNFGPFALSLTYTHDIYVQNYFKTSLAYLRLSVPLGDPFSPEKPVAPAQIPSEEGGVSSPPIGGSSGFAATSTGRWSGFYVGGQSGFQTGANTYNQISERESRLISAASPEKKGVFSGAHLGYLVSADGFLPRLGEKTNWLFGLEGDVDASFAAAFYRVRNSTVQDSSRQTIQGSFRGKIGLGVDKFMVYLTGGLAAADIGNAYRNLSGNLFTSTSHPKAGYTLGAGAEYGLTRNFSLFAEYRYTDLGKVLDNLALVGVSRTVLSHNEVSNRFTGGFNYRFDPFATVGNILR